MLGKKALDVAACAAGAHTLNKMAHLALRQIKSSLLAMTKRKLCRNQYS
jgi:predicted HTH domain antitoxin